MGKILLVLKRPERGKNLSGKAAILLALTALFLAACAQPADPGLLPGDPTETSSPAMPLPQTTAEATPSETPLSTVEPAEPVIPVPTLPEGLERIDATPQSAPVTGEVPASLLADIMDDLSDRLGVDPESIEIVKAEAILWPDGSLGCPQPDQYYTQALVNGYWVVLEVDEIAYDYRASEQGFFFLCERPLPQYLPNPDQ